MARFNIEVLGMPALSAALAALPERLERRVLVDAMKDATQLVLTDARARAPRGPTGRLARYLKVRQLKRSRRRLGFGVFAGTREQMGIKANATGFYPAHVHLGFMRKTEFGTRHVAARPFLRTALIENEPQVLVRLAQGLRRWLDAGAT